MKKTILASLMFLTISALSAQVKFDEKFLSPFEFRNFGVHRVGAWVGAYCRAS